MLEVNPEELLTLVRNLDNKLSTYDSHISELVSLSKQIEASTDWIDETVKPSFISYLNSYIEIYKSISTSLRSYGAFLKSKVNNFTDNETKFS
jgi:hypothetical protein